MSTVDWALSRGSVFSKDRIYVLAYTKSEQGTRVFRWTNKWDNYYVPFPARCIASLAEPNPEIITLGSYGETHSASPDGLTVNLIDDGLEAPIHRGELRCIKCIGRNVYVAGVGRQVYFRNEERVWSRYDKRTLDQLGSSQLVGFESLDGYSHQEIYCVGLGGEIWFCDRSQWCEIESPTNLALEKILCTPNGTVYAAGRSGMILCGRRGTWEVIEQEVTDSVFWDLAWFAGQLYLATEESVYVLDNGELKEINFMFDEKPTCHYLDANDGILCSIGCNDVAIFDGKIWTRLPNP